MGNVAALFFAAWVETDGQICYNFQGISCFLEGYEPMLRNNVELDLKTRFIQSKVSQTQMADRVGVSSSYINRITLGRERIINKTFLRILDELGYDVELTYRKKRGTPKPAAK